MTRRLVLVLLLLTACAKPKVPVPSARSMGTHRVEAVPVVVKTDPWKMRAESIGFVVRAQLGIVFLPDNLPPTTDSLLIIKAAGIERIEFLPQDEELLRFAQQIGITVAFTYQGSEATVDWLKAHFGGDWPATFAAMSMVDEPNPTSCPVSSSCYRDMQSLVTYAQSNLPQLQTQITLSAYAAFAPAARWALFAEPYDKLVQVSALDYFARAWYNDDYTVYGTLISNTRQYNNGKPVVFYSEGGSVDQDHRPIPPDWLVSAYQVSSSAGATAVVWFWTSGMVFGNDAWDRMVAAADQITTPGNDVNMDGVVDGKDYFLAQQAHNTQLAARIASRLHFVSLPMILK